MKQRKTYIDVAKGIGIYLVVWTHCPMFLATTEEMRGIITWVGAFHMPLFFYIYGHTQKRTYVYAGGGKIFISLFDFKDMQFGSSVFNLGIVLR